MNKWNRDKLHRVWMDMRTFLLLWSTQSFSGLGSAMTSYALVIWSYKQEGSALTTALLMVCSYAPYVLCSVFAGALSDRWNKKKTMLICDTVAALCTVVVMVLLKGGSLAIWHIYVLNAVNGLMNTVQQPASEIATTRVLPKRYYQRVGGIRYFSNALNSILTPILATAILGLLGMDAIIIFDLFTFVIAFMVLLCFIQIPEGEAIQETKERLLTTAKSGLVYLKQNRGILQLILFLASINLVASMYQAAFPAMMLSRNGGSEKVLGIVSTVVGVSTLLGSLLASFCKTPKSRVRVICNTLLFSMSTENLMLGLGRTPLVWCLAAFLGWILIPLMSTNLDAIMRLNVPVEMQGRVYATRNSLQFFTIPVGYFLGGILVDRVFEPIMKAQPRTGLLCTIFGTGKGTGAGLFFFVIAFVGMGVCLYFRHDKYIWRMDA